MRYKGKTPKSNYKYVRKVVTASGKERWVSQTCNGKFIYHGSFKKELIAAAVSQKAIGNLEEAKRLIALSGTTIEAERCVKNDHNRQMKYKVPVREKEPDPVIAYWECRSCGKKYTTSAEPKRCPCGGFLFYMLH